MYHFYFEGILQALLFLFFLKIMTHIPLNEAHPQLLEGNNASFCMPADSRKVADGPSHA